MICTLRAKSILGARDIMLKNKLTIYNTLIMQKALLSILLNCPHIDIGTELTNFKEFTFGLDSMMKGLINLLYSGLFKI